MRNSDLIIIITVAIVGATSLYALLNLFRQRFPRTFTGETKRLYKVLATQSDLEDLLAFHVEQAPSKKLLSSINDSKPSPSSRTGRLTVRKLLKYAQWPITPTLYYLISALLSVILFALCATPCNVVIHILCFLSGPIIMRCFLMYCAERRSERFDADYPQFLMSVVGLLKTGLTSAGALEAAAHGLDPTSLVRQEVSLMLERIRFGILEDTSVGSFGEEILHPEIELFVQALLLSNRLGGNLSESLERISQQARKRQHFKSAAQSAVALQRGSLMIIICILVLLQGYLYIVFPELIMNGIRSGVGWHVWQISIALIIIALFWVRHVTKIKV